MNIRIGAVAALRGAKVAFLVGVAGNAVGQTKPQETIGMLPGHGTMTSDQEKKERNILDTVNRVAAEGPFQASWDSLTHYQVPEWYKDAKFGIFLHWGVYSVPAFGSEWYPRQMYQQGSGEYKHQLATYGPLTKFGYKDFIPKFKAERFNPDAWVSLFKDAGARFVVPVAEHHDGFSMYDNSLSDWNAVKMGPHRDVVGELAKATRKQGLIFGVSSHRAEHWFFMNGGRKFPSDVQDPQYAGLYGPAEPDGSAADAVHLDNWLARSAELVDKYHPQIMWFDWWIGEAPFRPYVQKFASFYYNRSAEWGKGVAINYKNTAMPDGSAVLDLERGQLKGIRPMLWQTDTSISNRSWGYIEGDDFKPAGDIVQNLIDIVSKNGVLLLNLGPKPDGTIPDEAQSILRQIGGWLKVNGEAIYGTRPWTTFGEGPTQIGEGQFSDTKRTAFTGEDFRFTAKGNTLYAFALAWPGKEAVIKSLAGMPVTGVSLLGYSERLSFRSAADGLHIVLPEKPAGEYAFTFKIEGTQK